MSSLSGQMCLAQTDQGNVKMCAVGCTHLTFGMISLHFETLEDFQGFAETVLCQECQRDSTEGLQVTYNWVTIDLSPGASKGLAHLLQRANEAIAWSLGEMQITDEDIRQLLKGNEA